MSGVQPSAAVSADCVVEQGLHLRDIAAESGATLSGVEGVARHAVSNSAVAIAIGSEQSVVRAWCETIAATRARRNERDVSGASDDAEDRDQPSTSMTNPPGAMK